MIAPRKKLWSTPNEVVTTLKQWISLQATDVVLDVGCGDAKVLLQWASSASIEGPRFVGIEIDEDRAKQSRENVERAKKDGVIHSDVRIDIHCGNALEMTDVYKEATIVFLYLIPRGLRIIKPLLIEAAATSKSSHIQVVTYMSPLPDETPVAQTNCRVEHQPGAAWPLFLYHLKKMED